MIMNERYNKVALHGSPLVSGGDGMQPADILDDYPVSGVEVRLDWNGVTEKLPEGVRIIFYPKGEQRT